MNPNQPRASLQDRFGRVVRDLRISVTPRCNFHCTYCDPLGAHHHEPRGVLSLADVRHFLAAAASLGLDAVRFTGGEPLLRAELPEMIEAAAGQAGIADVSITTNGSLFRRRAPDLIAAGLRRVNISLDALDPAVFAAMSGGGNVTTVLDAIDLALELDLHPVKVNAVVIRGQNDDQVARLAGLALDRPLHVRFIEYMHLNNAEPGAYAAAFQAGAATRAAVEAACGPLAAVETDPSSPARVFAPQGALGTVGFINPVSEPFCGACSRMRLTADRKVRPCLLTDRELDAGEAFDDPDPVAALQGVLLEAARVKPQSGDTLPKMRRRTMVGIGG
ncbi:MAG TPA: GTP 3',8-cyclase MoaA [Deinococcales bacterium]|nr:GTP 3',8-cyclase MoaA [Deinococcales bacterium]